MALTVFGVAVVSCSSESVAPPASPSVSDSDTNPTVDPVSPPTTTTPVATTAVGTSRMPAASMPPAPAVAAVMPASTPVRIQIPAIGVDSGLLTLGLQEDGTLEVPPDGDSAGWYDGAPTPGELGPAIIVGHVDWGGAEGVFYNLRDLQPDDQVTITRADGSTAVFRVSRIEQFPKDEFPTDAVYGDIDHAGLRLMTCGGSFDRQARSYIDNIVVFADLV